MDFSQKSILITGGHGFLGSQIDYGIKLGRNDMDILNTQSIEKAFKRLNPEIVFHCAVNINMQDCEDNPQKAFKINVDGTRNIAEACQRIGAYLIFMSSNSVFSGDKLSPYLEVDQPDPVNIYGKTKYEAEKVVSGILPNALIIRTSWLFGKGNRSETKFTEICFNKLKVNGEIQAVFDRYGSPTFVPDMLNALYNLVNQKKSGVFHIANSGIATYYDMALYMKENAQLAGQVKSINASLYPSTVPRGPMEALDSRFIHLRSWTEAMDDYLTQLSQ